MSVNSNASSQEGQNLSGAESVPVQSLDVLPNSAKQVELPPELKPLEKYIGKTPIEGLQLQFPEMKPEGAMALAGFFSGLGIDFGIEIPSWAKEASRRMFEAAGLGFLSRLSGENVTGSDIGKFSGLLEKMFNEINASPIESPSSYKFLYEILNFEGAKLSPAESKEYFGGRADAELAAEKMLNLQQRPKIYLTISALWFEVQNLKSAGELFVWLKSQNTPDNIVIHSKTESREIREIANLIGLHYEHKGGRPRKGKTDADVSPL